ncbi:hypothetical protein AYI70_g4220 [Smittium culicis]|uniref:Uncharacterized protein n=1 Tax=Smittium culicis TaxID=133412 RepID=A0A1R1Y0N5_9FUNG|nr:hypothetical protein AYI70_g4220 [Smittium culicis]
MSSDESFIFSYSGFDSDYPQSYVEISSKEKVSKKHEIDIERTSKTKKKSKKSKKNNSSNKKTSKPIN